MRFDTANLFKVLSVGSRVKIVELLKTKGSMGTCEIAEALGVTPSAVSQHLRVLRDAGLIQSRRNGYWVPHSIDPEAMEHCRQIFERVCTCGCRGAARAGASACRAKGDGLQELRRRERELRKELERVRRQMERFSKA